MRLRLLNLHLSTIGTHEIESVMNTHNVLALDIAGTPFGWISHEEAVRLYACDKVAWDLGEDLRTFRGGTNRLGLVSTITIKPIVATTGANALVEGAVDARAGVIGLGNHGNALLFRRDRNTCAYCGEVLPANLLTRDHVIPRCRGGANTWMNCVTACRACNQAKAARDVRDFRPLLYLPYVPNRFEHFILTGRNILADQHEYLAAKLPKYSRVIPGIARYGLA